MSIISLNDVWEGFRKSGRRSLRDIIGKGLREDRGNILWALRDVSFEVGEGEAFGIIGPNGAGKTTILKLFGGILKPDKGKLYIGGKTSSLIELGVGFHPDLSARDNIYLNGVILGMSRQSVREKFDSIVKFAELEGSLNMPVKFFSSGMYLRLGFSIAVHTEFDILLVDEVLAVGDEAFQKKSFDRMKEFKEMGKTIIIVSHNLREVEKFCDRTLFLNEGKIVAIGETHKAILKYLKFVRKGEKEGKKAYLGRRLGNREAEILDVKMLDKTGNESSIFHPGETLTIKIDYIAHRRIDKPSFGIAIFQKDECLISGPNTVETGFPIEYIEGKGTIYWTIPELPLYENFYTLSVAIYDYNNKVPYDHHERMYYFEVQGKELKEKRGGIEIRGEWEIQQYEE